MTARRILCVAIGARPVAMESWLQAAGWEIVWATDLASARRLQGQLEALVCLVLLDRVDAALAARLEAAIASAGRCMWVAVHAPRALEEPAFQRLAFESFFDFHASPVDAAALLHTLDSAYRRAALRALYMCEPPSAVQPQERAEQKRSANDAGSGVPEMVGLSAAMVRLRRHLRKVAATQAPVLIGGESGSGKELAAQAIHRGSARAERPFVAVNCGAIVPALAQSELFGHERGSFTGAQSQRHGLIASAEGGTLFLDEIGDLPMEMQTSLLRFMQEKTIQRVGAARSLPVDVRVLAASHVDLAVAVAQGRFREDLYYRLNVLSIAVPPLRERKEDVPLLARHFFARCAAMQDRSRVEGFARPALAAMLAHDWPGNVRELFNRVQRAVVMTDRRLITPEDLELAVGRPGDTAPAAVDLDAVRTLAERDAVRGAFERVGGNVTHAARALGVSRMTLYRLLEKHDIAAGNGRLVPVGSVASAADLLV